MARGRTLSPLQVLVARPFHLGENPLWDERRGILFWEDIPGKSLHRWRADGETSEVLCEGFTTGGFTLQKNGDLLLFREKDIALLPGGEPGEPVVLQPWEDPGSTRFNDVIADPMGRVFAGTIGRTDTSGGLFLMHTDGRIQEVLRGTGCSNGMGFSPDGQTFYWTCSTRRQISAFAYEAASGKLRDERVIYKAGPGDGIPDGLTIDRNGDLWSARFSSGEIIRLTADGRECCRYPLPCRNITSLCFAGPERDWLAVTTAGLGREPEPAGYLFRLATHTSGPPEFRSRIQT